MGDQPSVEAHRELPPRPRSHIDLRSMICARNARATRGPWSELANYWIMPTRESLNASIAEARDNSPAALTRGKNSSAQLIWQLLIQGRLALSQKEAAWSVSLNKRRNRRPLS